MPNNAEQTWQALAYRNGLRWFGKHPTTRRLGGGIVTSPQSLERLLANLVDWNLYAHLNGVAPSTHGIKAAGYQIESWRYVLLDIDPIDGVEAQPNMAALALRTQLGPATWVSTGRGAHLWFELLTPVALVDKEQRLEIERGMAGWLRHVAPAAAHYNCRVDTCTSDLARIVRLPGSINQATGKVARIVQLGTPVDMAAYVLAHAPAAPEPVPSRPPTDTLNLARVIPHLTNTAQRYLTEGVGEGNRHAAAYASACSLAETGVPLERALNWVVRGGSLCSPPLVDEVELERATVRAYAKQGE